MITHVAIKDSTGLIWKLRKPSRHHNIIRLMHAKLGRRKAGRRLFPHCQGFLDNTGRFLDRQEAKAHALERGQIDDTPSSDLFSEDLW